MHGQHGPVKDTSGTLNYQIADMASEKRKHLADEASPKTSKKRRRSEENLRPVKPPKQDRKVNDESRKNATPFHKPMLVKEQPMFPRGGAGVLTPLERKQISARAVRDAELEHAAGQDLFGSNDTAETGSDDDEAQEVDVPASKSKKKKSQRDRTDKGPPNTAKATRIGGLSYKRIAVGSLILGCITSISERDLTIALPNNLTGFVPITAISKQLTAKIERLLEQEGNNNPDGGVEEDDDILLEQYFEIGQYLRVAVTSTSQEDATAGSRKRLELSVDPEQVNVGLAKDSLAVGCMAQVAVSSIEDHGLVVDLDLEGQSIRGFIPASTLPPSRSLSAIRVGTALLCQITHVGSNGKVVKLCADPNKFNTMKSAPNVECFLPGTLTDVLVTEVQDSGIVGKIMGMLDATSDVVQSGSYLDGGGADASMFKAGKKISGRLLYNLQELDETRLGFSVREHLIELQQRKDSSSDAISTTVSQATVCRVEAGLGIYLDLGNDRYGFAHISRLSDKKVDSISQSTGPYKVGSQHKARILDFSPLDDLFSVSLQDSILELPFLRVQDVPVGEVVDATIEKILVGASGVQGLVVRIVEGINGFVPAEHLADVALQHPERKFREGVKVKARVLSVDQSKRRVRLTLKKTLVNSDAKIWKRLEDIEVGDSSLGTLTRVNANGAFVQFYGTVTGFLPVSEMSEAYIKDAREHFRSGQVVNVNAISVDSERQRLTVSCRDINSGSQTIDASLANLQPGTVVGGTIFEKAADDVQLRLQGLDVIARLALDHVSDGSLKKRQSHLEKLRVGQRLDNLLVLDVQVKRRLVTLTNRQGLIQAAKDGKLLKSFEELEVGREVVGLVSNITSDGVFVSFASRISGLITPHSVPVGQEDEQDFGFTKLQTVSSKISHIDYKGATPRFWLTTRELSSKTRNSTDQGPKPTSSKLTNPVDVSLDDDSDLSIDRVTKARVVSVKDTQLNVELAQNVQGRIDVSEIFDKWEDITDRKKPLRNFSVNQILDVKILGAHDTRNHRFLPLSHRSSKNTVYELTAKPSQIQSETSAITYDQMTTNSAWIAFVNNVGHNCLWATISPYVRGRIKAADASDDLSMAANLDGNFPVGSALRVRVLACDQEKARLDLTAKSGQAGPELTVKDLSTGLILPGRITKVSDRQILVQLSDELVGAVDLIDLADDYDEANSAKYQKNDIVRICVVGVDAPNKRITLSLRPSRVLNSSIKPTDPEVSSVTQLDVNDIRRGFIRNVDDKGLFVMLGHGVTAFIRVGQLSDDFIKDWKDSFQRDQLVQGKVISVDKTSGHVQMSLKKSVLEKDYVPPITFNDLAVGDVVTGKVAKVEDFGVFIAVDNSENVRGLCHRSEIAERRVEDARQLFKEGDLVKAKVLKVDTEKRRINLGMKASYFTDSIEDVDDDAASDGLSAAFDQDVAKEDSPDVLDGDLEDLLSEDDGGGVDLRDSQSDDEEEVLTELPDASAEQKRGLSVGGFDWYGISTPSTGVKRTASSDTEDEKEPDKKRKRKKKPEVQIDRTGDLDANGPQSVDDYERLLLGTPDSSLLWLQYMAFHIELGDVDQARQIGERALKSIGLGQDIEKMNVWIALLNLENAYGDDETLDAIFRRACEYNDAQEMYSRLASIYIQSGKQDKADEMFQQMLKRFAQDPKVWTNYATYLMDTAGDADKARDLLPRALQILPKFAHLDLTSKFGQLEFKSSAGLTERGRTIFEGLVNAFPKRIDLYNVLLDLELKLNDGEQIRALFERILSRKLKPKQAKYFFKRWLAFEEKEGDERSVEDVKARAATWIKEVGNESS